MKIEVCIGCPKYLLFNAYERQIKKQILKSTNLIWYYLNVYVFNSVNMCVWVCMVCMCLYVCCMCVCRVCVLCVLYFVCAVSLLWTMYLLCKMCDRYILFLLCVLYVVSLWVMVIMVFVAFLYYVCMCGMYYVRCLYAAYLWLCGECDVYVVHVLCVCSVWDMPYQYVSLCGQIWRHKVDTEMSSSISSLPHFSRQGPSLSLKLTDSSRITGQQTPRIYLSSFLHAEIPFADHHTGTVMFACKCCVSELRTS